MTSFRARGSASPTVRQKHQLEITSLSPWSARRTSNVRQNRRLASDARTSSPATLRHQTAAMNQNLTRDSGEFVAGRTFKPCGCTRSFFGFSASWSEKKSPTIKMLTGLLAPTSGQIQILGLDPATNLMEVNGRSESWPQGMGYLDAGSGVSDFVGLYGWIARTRLSWSVRAALASQPSRRKQLLSSRSTRSRRAEPTQTAGRRLLNCTRQRNSSDDVAEHAADRSCSATNGLESPGIK